MSMLYLKPAVYKEKWTDEQLELEDIKDISWLQELNQA